jgi:hypothetical protein
VTGDLMLCAKVNSISGGDVTNGGVAIQGRESNAAGAPSNFFRISYQGIRPRQRGTVDTATTSLGSNIAVTLPQTLCFKRSGSTWTEDYSSDGLTFTSALTSTPSSFASTLKVGFLPQTGGTGTVTLGLQNVILTQHPNLTVHVNVADGLLHTFRIAAVDTTGNISSLSGQVSATAPGIVDNTGPAAPTGLTGSAVSTSSVSWSWTPPTDPSGILNCTPQYSTAGSGGPFTNQTATTTNTFTVTGLAPATTRHLKVFCTDGANNAGTSSSVVAATSATAGADTTPPTVPSGNCYVGVNWGKLSPEPAHTPCATGLSTSAFRITHTGSTDVGGCGVSGYRLYQSLNQNGPFTFKVQNSNLKFDWNIGTATPNTIMYFQLTAIDCAGNESARSTTFSDRSALASGLAPPGGDSFEEPSCANCYTLWSTQADFKKGYPYADPAIYGSRWRETDDNSLTPSIGTAGCGTYLDNASGVALKGSVVWHFLQQNQIQGAHCMINWQGQVGGGKKANFVPGFEYNESFNIYLKGNNWVHAQPVSGFWIIIQHHGNNIGTTNNPHFKIDANKAEGNPFIVQVLGDLTNEKPYDRSASYNCGIVTKNAWHRFEVQFRFGKDASTGYVKVYHNDELCVFDKGLNYFVGDLETSAGCGGAANCGKGAGPYVTFGIYNGWDDLLPTATPPTPTADDCRNDAAVRAANPTECTAPDGNKEGLFDDYRVGRGDLGTSYQEVMD